MDALQQATRIEGLRDEIRRTRNPVRVLEDLWLEDAYEAEAAGNYNKYNYILGWVRRVPELLRFGFPTAEKEQRLP